MGRVEEVWLFMIVSILLITSCSVIIFRLKIHFRHAYVGYRPNKYI